MSNAGQNKKPKEMPDELCIFFFFWSFAFCRREDVVKHRWNQMSVTGTEHILIILGQKVNLKPKIAKIVSKMSACSFEIIQRLQVLSIFIKRL